MPMYVQKEISYQCPIILFFHILVNVITLYKISSFVIQCYLGVGRECSNCALPSLLPLTNKVLSCQYVNVDFLRRTLNINFFATNSLWVKPTNPIIGLHLSSSPDMETRRGPRFSSHQWLASSYSSLINYSSLVLPKLYGYRILSLIYSLQLKKNLYRIY